MSSTAARPDTGVLDRAGLRSGTRIDFYRAPGELAERVSLSAGTYPVCDDPEPAKRYRDGAVLPRPPWRRATDEELALLDMRQAEAGRPWRPSEDAAIVRFPAGVIQPLTDALERHGLRGDHRPGDFRAFLAGGALGSAPVALLKAYVRPRCHDGVDCISFGTKPANQPALTVEPAAPAGSQLTGLHLDSWEKRPLRHRSRSRNRVCVNLGREPRYCLFLNLPLFEMFRCLGLRDPEDIYEDFRGVRVGPAFMRRWPDYPIVRLRIDPGEAYVLPTDNLIHDGSTEGTTSADITLTFIGCGFWAVPSRSAETAMIRNAVVRKRGDWLTARVADELVMMNVETGTLLGCNAIGARIWELLATPLPVAGAYARIAEEFAGDADLRLADVETFLDQLVRRGAAEISGGSSN